MQTKSKQNKEKAHGPGLGGGGALGAHSSDI